MDLTEHNLLSTCCKSTTEQGPSQSTLGHVQLLYGCDPFEAKVPFNGANPSSVSSFPFCGVSGIRTTRHGLFHGLALPWEYHMSTPPELSHLIVQRVGLEPTHLTIPIPKTGAATVTPPLH